MTAGNREKLLISIVNKWMLMKFKFNGTFIIPSQLVVEIVPTFDVFNFLFIFNSQGQGGDKEENV